MQNQLKSIFILERWINLMLVIKNQFRCYSFIQYWIHIINTLQPLITITYDNQISNWSISYLLYQIYITVIRPEIGICKFISIDILFALVIVIVTLHKIIVGLLLIIWDKDHRTHAGINLMILLAGMYQQTICKFLGINLQTLCFILIQERNYAYSVFAWLFIVFIQLDVFIAYLSTESPLTYKVHMYEKSKILISTIICNILKIVTHILFYCLTDASNAQKMIFANSSLVIAISLIEIIEQIQEKIYIYKNIQNLLFSLNLFNLFYSIFKILNQTNINQSTLTICLVVLFPIILYLIMNNKTDYLFYQDQTMQNNIPEITYQLIKVINKTDENNQFVHLRDIFINVQHRQYCQITDCLCRMDFTLDNVQKIAPVTDSMRKQYYNKKLLSLSSQLYQSVQGSKQKLLEQVINHSIMLYDFGQSINAMKTLNSILQSNLRNTYFSISYYQTNATQTKGDTNTILLSNNSETAEHKEFNVNFKVHLNIVQKLKLIFIINLAKQLMKQNLSQSFFSYQYNYTIEYLQKFLEFEFQMNEIKSMILQQAQQKINYYQKLNSDASFNLNSIFQITRETCSSMITTHNKLKFTFTNFPCVAIQRAICYYEYEIINNYSEARKINNQTAISDEKFLMFNQNLISKDKIGYIILEIDNDFTTTDVKFASHEFQRIYERQDYETKLMLDDLLPKFLVKAHPSYVEKFLTTGRSHFFQNFQLNFMRTHDGFIKGVKMCYDTTKTQKQQDKLIFAVFFSEMPDSKAYVLVDGITKFTYFSLSFLKKLGFQDHEIKFIKNSNIIQNLNISFLIPEFETFLDMNKELEIKVQGVEIYFANVFRLFSTIFTEKNVPSSQNVIQKIAWQRRDKLFKFNGNIQITRRYLDDYQYYIVEVLYIEDNIYTNILESSNKINLSKKLIQNNLSISSNESIKSGIIQQFEYDQPNKIQVLEFVKDEFMISHHCIDSISQPRIKILEAARFITPNESSSDTKRKFHPRNQQEFFSQKLSQGDIQALISEKKLIVPSEDEQQQIKIDIQSDHSSIEDVQKKKFLRKFELVDRLMIYRRPLKLIEILGLLTLQNITFTIFSLIAITVMFTDLSKSLKEIDAISLHSSIMTKHDIFFSMRATISLYKEFQANQIIKNATDLSLPFYNHLSSGYEDYQINLYEQYQDSNIQPYLDNYFMIIYLLSNLSDNTLLTKNVTIRECLLIDAQYQYVILNAFLEDLSTVNSSYQIFQFSNYVNIHQNLENLTLALLKESTGRSSTVADKWMIIWIFFQIGALILAIFNFYIYYNYMTFYDKFLLTLKFIDSDVINNEIDKHKLIIKQIRDNNRFLFEYQMDINNLQQPNNRKQRQLSIKQKESVNKKTVKLRRFSSFMLIFLLNLIFGGYSAVINEKTQIYLTKYEKTANLYKLFQDLSLGGGNCYLYKELLLGFNDYKFYFDEDRQAMYQLLADSQSTIQTYLSQISSLDLSNYLAQDSFITFFDELKTSDLCLYIDQDYLQKYCQLSFDGVMQSGLVATLNYVENSIKTEQAINNFTNRTEYKLYEQEGNQIITRVFFNMSLLFKDGLTTLTQDQTNLAYNLSISFFIYSFIVTFCLLFYLKSHLTWEYYVIRRVVSLIPIDVLLFDETLDRYLRELALHQELL